MGVQLPNTLYSPYFHVVNQFHHLKRKISRHSHVQFRNTLLNPSDKDTIYPIISTIGYIRINGILNLTHFTLFLRTSAVAAVYGVYWEQVISVAIYLTESKFAKVDIELNKLTMLSRPKGRDARALPILIIDFKMALPFWHQRYYCQFVFISIK